MAVGKSILTVRGSYALADASQTGKSIKPKYYKVSNQDIALDPTLTDLDGVWKQADISGYFPVNDNTVEFLVDIPPEQATDYAKTFGIYLEDGTLFMIAKPPYPFPPALRQTFKIQLVYNNANNLIDFQYLPFYETEQDLAILDIAFTFGERLQVVRDEIEQLKQAKEALFKNDKEIRNSLDKLQFASKLGKSGYIELPGGLIIQWGECLYNAVDGANGTVINFPKPFKFTVFQVVGTDVYYGCNPVGIQLIDKNSFRVWGKDSSGNFADTGIRWIAIGY